MPANPLFWIVLTLASLAYIATLVTLYSGPRDSGNGFHSGRTPGFSYTQGHNVGLDETDVGLRDGGWIPTRLETLHGPERSRLILSIAFEADDGAALRPFLRELADEIQQRAEADVVLVEARCESGAAQGRWEELYAPDGRGWWGSEQVTRGHRSPATTARLS